MGSRPPLSPFDIACLSSAVGLLLYWAMFMNVLPRLMRPEASTVLPLMSGVIGFVSCALSFIGLTGLIPLVRSKFKPRKTLVLRRSEEGRVVSIGWTEASYVTRTRATKSDGTHFTPKLPGARRHNNAKRVMGVAVLIAVIFGSYASVMVAMGYNAQDVVSGMYSPFMVISSQSMQPVLNYGDLVLVRREPAECVAVGDIIAFNVPSPYDKMAQSPTVHKVVEKLNENGITYFKTKGDNNLSEDQWSVPAENVIGKYTGKVPYIGFVVVFLKSPFGLAAIATLMALSFVYPYFKKRRRGGANP